MNDLPTHQSKVFFFHIPKCAGTTIWHYIRKIYGRRSVLQLRSKDDVVAFQEASPLKLRRYQAIGGHHWLSTYRNKLGDFDGYFKITTLRDPVDRLISSYNYIITSRRHHQYNEAKRSRFEDFALKEMANMQTRLLTGTEDYRQAIHLLDHWFDDYATTDQLHSLMRQLSEVGKAPLKHVRQDNISKKKIARETIDPAFLGRLEDLHQADMELFKHAQHRSMTMVEGDVA